MEPGGGKEARAPAAAAAAVAWEGRGGDGRRRKGEGKNRRNLIIWPGKKSSTPGAWKISSAAQRRRDGGGGARRDLEAMATATGRLSPPAATFSPRWEHCSW
uniref:Uncharacterized protein n=1 Tax=Oryza sativa subsp. japonica TaxID=39947 RepID=Q6Z6D1_ORYSJ|nr:unknown protein [Oryza sativa Japonica Group]BAD38435.1 unknown protein [Oryza sativa Japonica Group]